MSKLYSSPIPEITKMRVGEIKKELESYGISTRTFLEKKEMVEALEKARSEGKKASKKTKASADSTAESRSEVKNDSKKTKASSDSTAGETSVNGANASASSSSLPRSERIQQEMEKVKSTSVAELRKALKELGVRTTSFFEKSEFVRAYAEAIVDGVKSSSSSTTKNDEPFDASYKDVMIQKMNKQESQRFILEGGVIDVALA
eukprot:CAMPEP_0198138066 /NCGR_PEP_ID=MMETSP1443-20131203/1502_1 /TAXON_ID=186043 /ORGANISM="Entomoneis sp., Strain CCMP2396" /LENGTH=203 /DNA_ID=CAMNT_0043799701 /DNA_START=162 /DNA_END=773 /DNA_ORIENTATION=+